MSKWRQLADEMGLVNGSGVLAARYNLIPGWVLVKQPWDYNQYHFYKLPLVHELLSTNIIFDPGTPVSMHFPAGWDVEPDH